MKGNSKPFPVPELPEGVINLSDPDSRVMRTQGTPPRQAYNAQATVNDQQVILAAEITNAAPDFGQLAPMFEATMRQLAEQGVSETPEVVLADAGFATASQKSATRRAAWSSPWASVRAVKPAMSAKTNVAAAGWAWS